MAWHTMRVAAEESSEVLSLSSKIGRPAADKNSPRARWGWISAASSFRSRVFPSLRRWNDSGLDCNYYMHGDGPRAAAVSFGTREKRGKVNDSYPLLCPPSIRTAAPHLLYACPVSGAAFGGTAEIRRRPTLQARLPARFLASRWRTQRRRAGRGRSGGGLPRIRVIDDDAPNTFLLARGRALRRQARGGRTVDRAPR